MTKKALMASSAMNRPHNEDFDEWDDFDLETLNPLERIRKNERPLTRKALKQAERREHERTCGREYHRIKRERQRSTSKP